ncbi:MAG: hypothetical protein K1X28_01685 [Parachlamydiales bacterium]|nr:hypothetical protein [Parachlamydiales bacterium]
MSFSVADALARARKSGALTPPAPHPRAPVKQVVASGVSGDKGSIQPAKSLPIPDFTAFDSPKPKQVKQGADSTHPPLLSSPLRTSGSSAFSSPKTKTPPRRTEVLEPATPDKHIPTPERTSAKLRSPHDYHYASHLEKPPNKEIRNLEKRLPKKTKHTVILGTSPQKDVAAIKAGKFKPNSYGNIRVPSSTLEDRVWTIHPKNNPDGTNRLIPVKGPGLVPFDGSQLSFELSDFRASPAPSPTFKDHVEKNVKVVKRKKIDDSSPSSSSSSHPAILTPTPPPVDSLISQLVDDPESDEDANSPSKTSVTVGNGFKHRKLKDSDE